MKSNPIIDRLEFIRNTAFCSNTIHRLYLKPSVKVSWGWGILIWKFDVLLNILTDEELTKLDHYLLEIDPDYPDSASEVSEDAYEQFADYIKELEEKYK